MPSRRPPAVWLMLLLLVTLPQACDRPRGRAAAERRDALAEALSLSPEYSVDLPVLAAAQNSQRAPKIARGGAEMLAVWEDERSGPSGIYATRISSAGTILDPHGIRLTTAPGFQHSPAVAFDGTQYLVVWVDGQVSLPGGGIHSDIQGARIRASDGTVLDPAGLRITTTSVEEEGFPAVACAGGNCLVVWQTYLDGDLFRIRGVRVNGAGTVLDSAELLIDGLSDGPTAALFPDIASDGDQYLVVWQQSAGCPMCSAAG
jgi:large repetitive protein